MTVYELNEFFNNFLHKEDYPSDPSRNGIQIENKELYTKQIKKVAFAVDACEATAKKAREEGADVLVVHHGLFWGDCQTITGSHYKRISAFINNDVALIAYHIPLDANNPYGNNYGLLNILKMKNLEGFGMWRGMAIGVKGELEKALTPQELKELINSTLHTDAKLFSFGKKEIKTVGDISGGAGEDVEQAVSEGLDAYVTGEFGHELYHYAEEMKINVISAGHYNTETVGVNLLKNKVEKELGLETCFIHIPTGL